MRELMLFPLLLAGVLDCGQSDSTARRDDLTKRERDSMLGASQLPGAQGVRGALEASDSAAARREREDAAARQE